jgi:hypothetical protein
MLNKSIIYYTNNRIEEPIGSIVRETIKKAGLPIVSVSLKPLDFGENYVLDMKEGIVAMTRQIHLALEKSKAEIVFFTEHDVLYPKSHFDFTPKRKDFFYYDSNVWRWDYPKDRLIGYTRLISLSGMCCYRELALNHYARRVEMIYENGWENEIRREPSWARRMGYEPGTKKKKRGGFFDDDFTTWESRHPMIDIRHSHTFSPRKVDREGFKHQPSNWQETTLDAVDGWCLKDLFSL